MNLQATPLAKARHLLETQGRFHGGALPGDIADSWLRSLGHGLDPLAPAQHLMRTATELSDARARHADLIRFARPELELLFDQIAGSNFMIALGAPDGLVLETLTDTQFADTEAGRSVVPGSVWTEDLRGTNALGLCLATQRPAEVYGGEHFLRAHGDVSCISAPIFDGRGHLAGAIDASCGSAARQQHTAALVQMSAGNIENCLIRAGHDQRIILQFHPRPEYLGTLSVGMLVLDEDFTLHAVNRKGTAFLSGISAGLGTPFDQIFETGFEAVAARLAQGETLRLRDRFGSAVSMRCVANRASFALAAKLVATDVPSLRIAKTANPFSDVVIDDPRLLRALSGLPQAARNGGPICLIGEAGTGKEVYARLAHVAARSGQPLVAVDCSTLGGAVTRLLGPLDSTGLLAEASGGSLYFGNVEALAEADQTMLARIIEKREYRHPVSGGIQTANILFLFGASVPLERAGLVPSLRYRLAESAVSLPALRDRSDLGALALRFARTARADATLAPGLVARLAAHCWPGNLDELRAVMCQAARRRTEGRVTEADLEGLLPDTRETHAPDPCRTCSGVPWKEAQCSAIQEAVGRFNGNIARAARDLGMSRTTIYKHLPPP